MTDAKNRLLTIGAFIKKKKSRPALSLLITAAAALTSFMLASGKAAAKGFPHLLFVGDSLTEGYGVASHQAYPYLVAQKLKNAGFPGLTFTNSGSSGATSSFGPKMVAFQLKKRRPDYVVYALGSNDGLRGIDPKATRKKIEQALDLLKKAQVPVLLTGQRAAPNYGKAYTTAFDGMFPAIAKERGIAFLPFLLKGVAADPKLNLPDGIHPNPAGYRVIARRMADTLAPLLKALAQPSAPQPTAGSKPKS